MGKNGIGLSKRCINVNETGVASGFNTVWDYGR